MEKILSVGTVSHTLMMKRSARTQIVLELFNAWVQRYNLILGQVIADRISTIQSRDIDGIVIIINAMSSINSAKRRNDDYMFSLNLIKFGKTAKIGISC